jgi:hypothetical protein
MGRSNSIVREARQAQFRRVQMYTVSRVLAVG